MSFGSPLWLLALAAIPAAPALLVFAGRRRRRYAVRYPALDTLAGVAATLPARRRHVPAALALLAAVALVLASARPQVSVAVPVERSAVMLVVDVSGSMRAPDVDPSRIEATRRAAARFVDRVPDGRRVGLVSFSDAASLLQTPTTDHAAVRAAIASLPADGATATGEGLATALDEVRPTDGERPIPAAIVLLSDGRRTAGRDPLPVARQARELRIPVFTISLGTPEGRVTNPHQPFLPPVPVPPDPETLRRIAQASGGQAFRVEDADRLDRVFERLGSRLGTERRRREVTAGFAGGGLVLLAAALVLGLRRRPRLP